MSIAEASFQTRLRRVYKHMQSDSKVKPRETQGFLFCKIFPRAVERNNSSYAEEFQRPYFFGWLPNLKTLLPPPALSQLEVSLINGIYWGGNTLVVICAYRAQKQNLERKVVEVTLWDDGPGIPDLAWALTPNNSSQNQPSHWAGYGVGIDVADYGVHRVDEMLIKSGQQRAYRLHCQAEHIFEKPRASMPGTQVILRSWEPSPIIKLVEERSSL